MSVSDTTTDGIIDSVQRYAANAMTTASGALAALSSSIAFTPAVTSITLNEPAYTAGNITATVPSVPAFDSAPNAPNLGGSIIPGQPSYVMPTVPTLTTINIPDFVDANIPGVTSTIPGIDFVVPNLTSIDAGAQTAEDTLMAAIKAKLLSNIQDGGTMLVASVEDDIWDRDNERHEQQLQDSIDKVTAQWAKMGFSLPDGLLAGELLALNNEYLNQRLTRSREIAIKQAELEQEGMFRSLEIGTNVESVLIKSADEYAARVLAASKATAEIMISLFQARVTRYNSLLEAFKADMANYELHIRAELQRAEVYKAKLQALLTASQIDESKVKLYSAQLQAIGVKADIYKTQVQAAALTYEAEKTQMEGFKAEVQAYVGKVDAQARQYVAEMDGYKADVQAQAVKIESESRKYESQSKIEIAKAEVEIKQWENSLRVAFEAWAQNMEKLRSAAQVSGNLAAGALSAMHASASKAYQWSESQTTSL